VLYAMRHPEISTEFCEFVDSLRAREKRTKSSDK